MQTQAPCPYCGELVVLFVDESAGAIQRYVEDCSVCCRPWNVVVSVDDEGNAAASLHHQDD